MSSETNNNVSQNEGNTTVVGGNLHVTNSGNVFPNLKKVMTRFLIPGLAFAYIKDGIIYFAQQVQPYFPQVALQPTIPGTDTKNKKGTATNKTGIQPEGSTGMENSTDSQPVKSPPSLTASKQPTSPVSATSVPENPGGTMNSQGQVTVAGDHNNVVMGSKNDVSNGSKNVETIDQSEKPPDSIPGNQSPGNEVAANAAVQPTVNVVVNVPKQSTPASTQKIASALPYDPPRRSKQAPDVGVSPKAGSSGKTHQPNGTPKPSGEQAPAPKVPPKKPAPATPNDSSNSPWFPKTPDPFIPPKLVVVPPKPVPVPGWGTSPDPDAPVRPHVSPDEVQPGTLKVDNRSPNPNAAQRREEHGKGNIALGLEDATPAIPQAGNKRKALPSEKPKAPVKPQPIQNDEPKVGLSKYDLYMDRRVLAVKQHEEEHSDSNVMPALKRESPVPRSSSTHEALPSAQAPVPAKYEPVQKSQPMTQHDPDIDPGMIMTSKPGTDTNHNDAM